MKFSLFVIILAISVSSGYGVNSTDFRDVKFNYGAGMVTTASYYISYYRASREQANYDCHHVFSGRLLTILTKEQDEAMNKFIEENSGIYVLTSGSRGPNYWYWDSNLLPFIYTNWRLDHPVMDYDCLCVGGTGSRYGWYSVPCTNQIRFICEV